MELIFTYHPFWLILTSIFAAAYAVFTYFRTTDGGVGEFPSGIKAVLAGFRFVYTWCILFLLLGVVLESLDERKEKPILFFAHDNSESILLCADSTFYRNEYVAQLQEVTDVLSQKYEVVSYSFSDQLTDGLSNNYSGKTTNISNVFSTIFDQYANRNIGAVILSSDGIYNAGANPIYEISRKGHLPVFTIGLGDTSAVRDVRIDEVLHNDIAFLDNQFPVEVVFSATQCLGENVSLKLSEGDRMIDSKSFVITSDGQQLRANFVLTADRIGFRKYTVAVTALSNEFSHRNNSLNFYVEVINGRQKILLAHSAPHPDLAAMRFVIENNKNYEVDVLPIEDVTTVKPYDMVIVHNYSARNDLLNTAIDKGEVPFLFIVGQGTDMRGLSDRSIGFSGKAGQTEELGFAANSTFREILLTPEMIQLLSGAPPLSSPFGNITYSSALDILAYQKVGNIQLNDPLIYFTTKEQNRVGVIMGEGIWRWRLYDQMKHGSVNNFSEFFTKLVTFLAVKENKDPFRIKIENEFYENEDVIVEAELYNQSYELINEPEVSFVYENESGKRFESFLVRNGSGYRLNLGKLPAGLYKWSASTTFQDKKYKRDGNFLVKEVKIELLNAQADHRLLHNIAENSGGKFYSPHQLSALQKDLEHRNDLVTVVYQEKSFVDLIDRKWLFFLIVLFLSAEYGIRKYLGAY